MAWAQQVHGDRVRTVHVGGPAGEADALVSAEAGLTLLIAVADCGPVLLHDATRRIIGAAHAGWRGCVAGICERTVEAMVRLGAEPAGIRAWVGPCIGPEHFEVGEEVAAQFSAAHVRRGGGRPHVDLPAAITARLVDAGLDQDRIQRANQCTFTLAERYWSYRRDGGICGRQFAWIRRAADGR